MERIVIVGSGASGVHFALSVLKKGYEVLLLDVGHTRRTLVEPASNLNELKAQLSDPVNYFLGESFEAVVYPDLNVEYYGFPPNKSYVFSTVPGLNLRTNGFKPLLSFAQGGLAEVWTGGVYPFNDNELIDFPFDYKDIEPFYNEVANRIGVSGMDDDLGRFMPVHENLMPPLSLDRHSALLLAEYQKQKSFLNRELRCFFGRARIATLSEGRDDRHGCVNLGRCLWGCPGQSLYTPSITLSQCSRFSNFRYIPDRYVSHFKYNSKRRITAVVARSVRAGDLHEFPVGKLVLASGTLSSSKIFLESIYRHEGSIIKLHGLMDNRQVLVPFVNLNMLGKPYTPNAYQYHQIALGIERDRPCEYIHGLVTTLKSAMVHPILQKVPFDLRTSTFLFQYIRSALGLVNTNFPDNRREDNYITLEARENSLTPALIINYAPAVKDHESIKEGIKLVKQALRKVKCVVPPGMVHVRPMGASVHYAGTIPMAVKKSAYTTSEYCQSHDFDNLYIVDGTTFPFLPAKNITFTLMANAVRVAECAF